MGVDENGDKIRLPADDSKEAMAALKHFKRESSTPVRIFVELARKPSDNGQDGEKKEIKPSDRVGDAIERMESTVRDLGQQIVTLLQNLSNDFISKNIINIYYLT